MNNNKPFDHEIETLRDISYEMKEKSTTDEDYRYFTGIMDALDWVLGNTEYPPMEK